jgi:tetratricopeptide (TPR) repeat protein
LGRTKLGTDRLERLTRILPNDDESWRALSFAYSSAGRTRDAERALRRAIQLAPNRAVEHRDLGVLLAKLERPREAREEYVRALAVDSSDATVWYNLGNLERRGGDPERALASYRAAEARDSGFALPLQGQIHALTDLGREREAGEVYRRWLKIQPDDHNARVEAVRLYGRMGRRDIAIELARDGVRHDPRSPDARMIHGMELEAQGQTRAALTELRRAEALFRTREEREQVEVLIETMRASAPDSLRAMFAADSAAHRR